MLVCDFCFGSDDPDFAGACYLCGHLVDPLREST